MSSKYELLLEKAALCSCNIVEYSKDIVTYVSVCGHTETYAYKTFMKYLDEPLYCRTCEYYGKLVKKSKELNCKLLTTLSEFIELKRTNKNVRDEKIKITYEPLCLCSPENISANKIISSDTDNLCCRSCITSYNNYNRIFTNNGCTILTTCVQFGTMKKNIALQRHISDTKKYLFTYIATCSHENTIEIELFNKGNGRLCSNCSDGSIIKESIESVKKYYDALIVKVEKLHCKMITTFEEFNKLRQLVKGDENSRMIRFDYLASCGHLENILCRTFTSYKDEQVLCKHCANNTVTRTDLQGVEILSNSITITATSSYNKYVEIFKEHGCYIITTLDEFLELRKNVKLSDEIFINYIATCSHKHNIQIKSFLHMGLGRLCYTCARVTITLDKDGTLRYTDRLLGIVEKSYYKFKQIFLNEGCIFITTLEEFIDIRKKNEFNNSKKISVTYIANCGHVENTVIDSFVTDKCGLICKKCSRFANKREDGSSKTIRMEDDAIIYITSIISDKFEVSKNIEGCLSDFAIRPWSVKEDKWLMIQQKTTDKIRGSGKYKFKASDRYIDCVMCFLCLSDKRNWILDGSFIKTPEISISKISKYNKNEVTSETICNILKKYYNKFEKYPYNEINTPISETAQLEQKYRILREQKCSFVDFKYSEYSQLVYDFMINGKKFQEKVRHPIENVVNFILHKNDGFNKLQSYKKGDNDYYWLHVRDTTLFLVIPENILLQDNSEVVKFININLKNIENSKWYEYLFDYNNIDLERFYKICRDIL